MTQRKPKSIIVVSAVVGGKKIENPQFCPIWQIPASYVMTDDDGISELGIHFGDTEYQVTWDMVKTQANCLAIPKIVCDLAYTIFIEEALDPKVYGYRE